MDVFKFISDQILGMKWLNELIGNILTSMGLNLSTNIGQTINFFIYDVIKIVILLCVLIFLISYIQSYFPPERTKKILNKITGIKGNIIAALLGTVTPFCSCSSIPIFIGFTNIGLPLGITFSFLISSPLVDLGSLILIMSIFGFKIAVLYVIVGLILAVIGGTLIDHLGLEDQIKGYIKNNNIKSNYVEIDDEIFKISFKERIKYAYDEVVTIFKKVFPYILVGVGIGALIHNWIPQSFIEWALGSNNPLSIILASIIGIPMYADIFGAIPIAEALYFKGAGLGTVLSFMMSVTALSLPSIVLLKNVIKNKLLAIFIAIVTIGIMIIGFSFNFFQYLLI